MNATATIAPAGPQHMRALERANQVRLARAELKRRVASGEIGVAEVILAHQPHEAAVEETFVTANGQSTLKLGHARAAVMIAPARAGLPVAEYAAKVVKKAVVGVGGADKTQVAFMVARLLPSAGLTTSDSADALAVAIAHAHARTRPSPSGEGVAPKARRVGNPGERRQRRG